MARRSDRSDLTPQPPLLRGEGEPDAIARQAQQSRSHDAMPFHLDLSDPDQAHAAERLRSATILWLASVRPDERPHLVPVWFLWEGATILIFSKPKNQKIRNLRQNPAVTVSLDDTDEGDDVVVLEGVA